MEKNSVGNWVDQCLKTIDSDEQWQPEVNRAYSRLVELRKKERRRTPWMVGALFASLACACLLAFPTSRDFLAQLFLSGSTTKMIYVGQAFADLKTLKNEQLAPDFTLKDVNGKEVRLSDYKDRVVLINFWATWCAGCQTEIPWLVEFDQKYRAQGLSVLGIAMDDGGWTVLRPYLQTKNVNYPVVIGNDETAHNYGMTAMPMTFLIDRGGRVSAASAGIVNKDECEKEIQRLLKK